MINKQLFVENYNLDAAGRGAKILLAFETYIDDQGITAAVEKSSLIKKLQMRDRLNVQTHLDTDDMVSTITSGYDDVNRQLALASNKRVLLLEEGVLSGGTRSINLNKISSVSSS